MEGWLFWALVGAGIGYAATQRTGDAPVKGVIIGALLGPLALLMLLAKPATKGGGLGRMRCPHCQEWISDKATACPRCTRDIPQTAPAAPAQAPPVAYPQPRPPGQRR